ncbi:hypothetical protein QYF61_024600 [Mycteria americana]|uniref:Uncharacterized protein n=1 Tax=Mycteria americana TaxID=33587 RepID=A0AAN7NWX5_MYCAM|nr:hypothetical protein QYF61_024600 [Mycteria americana]
MILKVFSNLYDSVILFCTAVFQQPVPVLDKPFGEEIFPNIQPKPPLDQLEAVSSFSITCYVGEETDTHLSTTSFQTVHQLRCPSLDTLQHLNVSLVVGGPKLNTAFEVQPHQCPVQGHDHFPSPAGHTISDTSQDAIGLLGHLGTSLAHIQPNSLSREVRRWDLRSEKENAASEGEESPHHPFPERKHDILEMTTHYPKLLQGFKAWGCLRGVLGAFWHPEAHDGCVTKASAGHILTHMPGLAAARRPRLNHSMNTGPKLIPSTDLYVHVNMPRHGYIPVPLDGEDISQCTGIKRWYLMIREFYSIDYKCTHLKRREEQRGEERRGEERRGEERRGEKRREEKRREEKRREEKRREEKRREEKRREEKREERREKKKREREKEKEIKRKRRRKSKKQLNIPSAIIRDLTEFTSLYIDIGRTTLLCKGRFALRKGELNLNHCGEQQQRELGEYLLPIYITFGQFRVIPGNIISIHMKEQHHGASPLCPWRLDLHVWLTSGFAADHVVWGSGSTVTAATVPHLWAVWWNEHCCLCVTPPLRAVGGQRALPLPGISTHIFLECSKAYHMKKNVWALGRTGGKDGEGRSTPCSYPHLELGSGGGLHLGVGAGEHCWAQQHRHGLCVRKGCGEQGDSCHPPTQGSAKSEAEDAPHPCAAGASSHSAGAEAAQAAPPRCAAHAAPRLTRVLVMPQSANGTARKPFAVSIFLPARIPAAATRCPFDHSCSGTDLHNPSQTRRNPPVFPRSQPGRMRSTKLLLREWSSPVNT